MTKNYKLKLEASVTAGSIEEALAHVHRGLKNENLGYIWSINGVEALVTNGKLTKRDTEKVDSPVATPVVGHRHAAAMLKYAQQSATDDKAFKGWEYRWSGDRWCELKIHPVWELTYEYREKPKTFTLNDVEVPLPLNKTMGAADLKGISWGFAPNLVEPDCPECINTYATLAEYLFTVGMLHSTQEAATIHAKAILAGGLK